MPSPIAHLAAGSLIAHHATRTTPSRRTTLSIWAVCLFFSMVPDLDTVAGLLTGELHVYHNQMTHSLLFALLISLAATWPVKWLIPSWGWYRAFLIPFACASLHVAMDWTTRGRGVLIFWPFNTERWLAPVTLFYGVRWSDGWISYRHWITLGTELATLALGFILYRLIRPRLGDLKCRKELEARRVKS